MKTRIVVLVGIMVCTMLLFSPVLASGAGTLEIYGNANEDDTIDMRDLTYVKLIFFGKKPETELADAKYDGKINPLDFIQIKLIIVGKEKEITIVDGADRTVTVKKPVEKIVIFSSEPVETLRSIKAADTIVGVGTYTKKNEIHVPEISELPSIGSPSYPDLEKVLDLRPDLVILYTTYMPSACEDIQTKLEAADPNIRVVRFDCYRPDSYVEDIKKLGYILGKKEEAKEFIDFYQGFMNSIKEEVEELSETEKPKDYMEGHKPYRTGGIETIIQERIVAAGGNNIFGETSGYSTVDPEAIIMRDPEIIIKYQTIGGYDLDVGDTTELEALREEIMARKVLAEVPAVKTGSVYITSKLVVGGAKQFLGIGYMAKWFHPDLFSDLDMKEIHQQYITEFQGLDIDLDEKGVFVYHPDGN